MVEQVLGIALQLAIGVQIEAAAETFRSTLVEREHIEVDAGRAAARDFVRRELVTPAERVPDARVVFARGGSAIEAVEAVAVLLSSRHQYRAQVFQRFDVIRIDGERASAQRDRLRCVARFMSFECLPEKVARFVRLRQPIASTSFNSSSSVNTRNEAVRTLPWLLTDIDTRDIVSSSGASAMTT